MRISAILVSVLALASPLWAAQESLPLEFDSAEAWQAQPAWLSNPAASPAVKVAEGVAAFTIAEPNKGMKWHAELRPYNLRESGFLLVRYRAENFLPGGDYFL